MGCLYKDGIVLGADTRATEGPIVADKNCEKVRLSVHSLAHQLLRCSFVWFLHFTSSPHGVPFQSLDSPTFRRSPRRYAHRSIPQIHYITENIRCCGAGTAADTEFTTALISSNMELHALNSGRTPRVVTAMTMLKQYLFRCVINLCYFLAFFLFLPIFWC